jgi:hypothetical protein
MLSAVPNLIGHQVDVSREAATIGQRSLTEEEKAAWYGATGAGRAYWSRFQIGGKGGADVFQEGITRMQSNGPAPAMPNTPAERERFNAEQRVKAAEAEATMNQAMALAVSGRISDPVAFAERLDKLQLTHRPRDKMSLATTDFVFERLQQRYAGNSPEEIAGAIRKRDTERGAITSAEIIAAAVGDVANPRTQSYLRAKAQEWSRAHGVEMGGQLWQGENQLQPDELAYVRRRRGGQAQPDAMRSPGEWVANPEGVPVYSRGRTLNVSAEQQQRLERLLSAESGNASALSGMNPASVPAHQIATDFQYQFTSIAGLAEKMQMEATKGPDVADRQLQVLQEIRDNTKRESTGVPRTPEMPHYER